MNGTIEAVYEDGVLKPREPLDLADHEVVGVFVIRQGASLARQLGGFVKGNLDPELAIAIAESHEFDLVEF